MNEHHKVLVVRIEEIKPHTNAERLEIIPILGYQAISAKGQFKLGDLAYYVPPDSVVPERPEFEFLWLPNTYEGGVPERKRRIAAKRLRGEWSEGLLMSATSSDVLWRPNPNYNQEDARRQILKVKEGDDVAELLGITHYDPPEPDGAPGTSSTGQKQYPKTWRGWLQFIKMWIRGERREKGPKIPTYDVKAFKHFARAIEDGELVSITEKIHGSNARYSFEKPLLGKSKFYAGSRNLWKATTSGCVWREATRQRPWIKSWCESHPGYALYGEVVSTSTQKGFHYGCKGDEIKFFVFDILKPDGKWADVNERNELLSGARDDKGQAGQVPWLYSGPWNIEIARKLVDGNSTVPGANHIREGIVIKSIQEKHVPGVGRLQLKWVSNAYYERSLKD